MECKSCGAQIDENASQCPYCNAAVARATGGTYQGGTGPSAGPGPIAGSPGPTPATSAASNRVLVGILAIVLGGLGVHKFILGYQKAGIIMVCVTIFTPMFLHGYGAGAMWVVGIIEGIMYLMKSDQDFYNTYVAHKKEWF
jgi:TM2 domain-containing membrane protein YozV